MSEKYYHYSFMGQCLKSHSANNSDQWWYIHYMLIDNEWVRLGLVARRIFNENATPSALATTQHTWIAGMIILALNTKYGLTKTFQILNYDIDRQVEILKVAQENGTDVMKNIYGRWLQSLSEEESFAFLMSGVDPSYYDEYC